MYDINHERLMDLGAILIVIGFYVLAYFYGKYKYSQGFKDGARERRKLNRKVRRGEIYRIK